MRSLFQKKATSIGIDIGYDSVRLIKLYKYNNELYLDECVELCKQPNIYDALKKLVRDKNIVGKSAIVALKYSSILTKVIDLDSSLSFYEIWKYLCVNSKKHFGLLSQNICVDFEILDYSKSSANRINVQLIAARRSFVEERVSLLAEANLKIKALDVEHLALARAGIFLYATLKNEIIALINCKNNELLFCVIKNKKIVYTNEVNVASNESIDSIIIAELQLFFATYNFFITHLVLSGDSGIGQINLLSIENFFKTKISIRIVNPFININISEKIDRRVLNSIAPSFMISFGLALRRFLHD